MTFQNFERIIEGKNFSRGKEVSLIFYDFQILHVLQPNFCHEIVEKSGPLVIYLKKHVLNVSQKINRAKISFGIKNCRLDLIY